MLSPESPGRAAGGIHRWVAVPTRHTIQWLLDEDHGRKSTENRPWAVAAAAGKSLGGQAQIHSQQWETIKFWETMQQRATSLATWAWSHTQGWSTPISTCSIKKIRGRWRRKLAREPVILGIEVRGDVRDLVQGRGPATAP